ncbi:MAG: hypothetical protein HYX72_00775 [Acidobacteria bacterium]|nr:hypothetical protein [Acidobacteriota bacterium]
MPSTQNTDVLTASLGRPIVLAYGKHLVAGNVILMDQTDPEYTIAFIALGEGEWDAIEELWVDGRLMDVSTPENYQFHKGRAGELSSDGTLNPEGVGSLYPFEDDGDQMADSLTPPGVQGLTFSRTCYISLKIPQDVFAPGPGLSFQGVFRTRKVRIFNAQGVQTAYVYSENPAWQIADLLTQVRGLPDWRIDWESFAGAAAYCDETISSNGGNPRFVSHIAFTREVDFDQALNAILVTCRGMLRDSEGTIKLRIDQPRTALFDLTMDNIVDDSFSVQWLDTRATVNRLELGFRDPDNGLSFMTKLLNHEPQQTRTGRGIAAAVDLGNMPQHQAERIGSYLLTRAIDNNLYCRLRATQASLAVMPGDIVRVMHDASPWSSAADSPAAHFETFEVLECSDNPDETRDFLLQIYRDATYPDTAGPAQNLQGATILSRAAVPPKPPNWKLWLSVTGEVVAQFAIPDGADYRSGDLTLLCDDEIHRRTTTVAVDLTNDETHLDVASSVGFLVGDYVNVGTEILQITGPGARGAQPAADVWEIARGQKISEVQAAMTGAVVYRLSEVVEHFVLPPGYSLAHSTGEAAKTLSSIDDGYSKKFRVGNSRILHASLTMTGPGGSVTVEQNMLAVTPEAEVWGNLPGLRANNGGVGMVQIPGPLAVGSDLAMPLILPPGVSIQAVYALMESGPVGADVQLQLQIDDVDFGPVGVIPAQPVSGLLVNSGTILYGAQQGNVGGRRLSINVLQVGSDDPGSDLTVKVLF